MQDFGFGGGCACVCRDVRLFWGGVGDDRGVETLFLRAVRIWMDM